MDLAKVHTLFDVLGGDRFDLLYSGRFSDEHSAGLIALGEEALLQKDRNKAHQQRLAFVMVEAYQNVVRHRVELPPELARGPGRCLFLLRCGDGGDEVVSIDPVHERDIPLLRSILKSIVGLDLKELKRLFLDRLSDGKRSERGGAGLGLIEMARRSGNGLKHTLAPLDAQHQLFVLQVMVDAPVAHTTPAADVISVHELAGELDLMLLLRCGPSSRAQEAVLHILEKEYEVAARASAAARAYLAATEWLQGVSVPEAHIVGIGKGAEGHALVVGALFEPDQAAVQQKHVERINGLSQNERERHYRNALIGREEEGVTFPMGLLDLARCCTGPLTSMVQPAGRSSRLLVKGIMR